MIRKASWLALSLCVLGLLAVPLRLSISAEPEGTRKDPIVDSALSEAEAFDGLDPQCPKDIRERQKLVTVLYWGFDKKVHRGQIVIDKNLEKDIVEVFEVALKHKFPIHSVIPVAHPAFRKDHVWSDDLSMAANNTSAFNYRLVTGKKTLSNHAYGRAIDINPLQNPYIKGDVVLPPGAKYERPSRRYTDRRPPPHEGVSRPGLEMGWQLEVSQGLPALRETGKGESLVYQDVDRAVTMVSARDARTPRSKQDYVVFRFISPVGAVSLALVALCATSTSTKRLTWL